MQAVLDLISQDGYYLAFREEREQVPVFGVKVQAPVLAG